MLPSAQKHWLLYFLPLRISMQVRGQNGPEYSIRDEPVYFSMSIFSRNAILPRSPLGLENMSLVAIDN